MKLFRYTHRHFRAFALLGMLVLAAGTVSATRLPVGLFPNVAFPRIVVSVESGETPADEMVVRVTRPIEEALSAVPGIAGVRSTTSRGACDISASFDWGTDMASAALQVQSAVNQAQSALPTDTHLEVRRMDPTIYPVLGYSLTSPTRPSSSLRELALHDIRPMLLRVPGVSRVSVLGGSQRELQIVLDPERLRANRVAPRAVVDAVQQGQALDAAGLLESHHQLYLTLTDGRATTPEALAARAVATAPGGQSVRVGDLGTVVEAEAPHWTRVRANGRDAVLLEISQQHGASTLDIQTGIQQVLRELGARLPADVKVTPFYDQASLIREAMGSVRDAILVGIALGVVLIGLFLRRARLTLLAALAVPLSLAGALVALDVMGLGLNVMTLGGLAAAVGLVLDDAIVMLEAIAARLAAGSSPSHAAAEAVAELGVPFVGSSLCSIVVFAPLAYLSGVSGAFFRFLSLTMVAALACSLLASLFLLPPLAARVLKPRDAEQDHDAGRPGAYRRLLGWLLPRPWFVGTALALMIGATGVLYTTLPNGFLPDMDEGAFTLDYVMPPGSALADTTRTLERIEGILAATPEVASYARRTGLQMGGALTEANQGDIIVRLHHQRHRDIDAVQDAVRERIAADVPGVRVEFSQLMEDMVGDLIAVPQPIEIKVLGGDLATQQDVARRIAEGIGKVPGVVDVFNGITEAGPVLRAVMQPGAAGRYGLAANDVADALTVAVEGEPAGAVVVGDQVRPLRVRVATDLAGGAAALRGLPVALPGGGTVALDEVAKVVEDPGSTEITREHLAQMVAVTARIEGAGLTATVDAIKSKLAHTLSLPAGVSLAYGGLYAEQQASFRGLLGVIAAAFALVLVVLLFTLRRVGAALAVLAIDLASLFGVTAALALTGTKLNVGSMMGAVMIVGIVAENAVFYIHAVEHRRAFMPLDEALVEAGRVRRRPVVMTTLAAILALLPLALGLGAGAELQRPLAIAVIGGFALSSLLILVALPVAYRMLAGSTWPGSSVTDEVPRDATA